MHAQIQEFFQGGPGQKTVWTTFFISSQLILQFYGFIAEKTILSKDPEGVQHFPGGVGGSNSLQRGGGSKCSFL